MCLNLFNVNSTNNWMKRLYTVLGLLVPGSHYLALSRQQLDSTNFVPVKDFEVGLVQIDIFLEVYFA